MSNKKTDLRSTLSIFLSEIDLKFNIRNLRYLPRWVVLFMDVFVLLVSFVFTKLIVNGMGLPYIVLSEKLMYLSLHIGINIFFFWIFRTYAGIIRHSSYVDALKLLFSQISVFVFFYLLNHALQYQYEQKLFLNTGLFINMVVSFCGLFLYRVVVKQTFENYFSEHNDANLVRTMIYGTDANALAIANALKMETPARFKVVGFIDKNLQNSSKRMMDLPIFVLKRKLAVVMRMQGAQVVIMADKSLSNVEYAEIVEQCLEQNYKVYTIPVVTDWEDKKEISKNIKNIQIEDILGRKPIVLDNYAISNQLKGKTVLITGAAGSIGSEIVRQVFLFDPQEIIALDQAETPLHNLNLEFAHMENKNTVLSVVADVRNKESMEAIFRLYQPDVVYHAAAYKHVPLMEDNPSEAILTNVAGTKIVADLATKYKVKNFVMISTDKAVNPSNVMGASKRIAEKYVQSLQLKLNNNKEADGTKFITTRFGNVLGSNGSVVPLFTKQINEGGPITITHPDIIRYFMTIPEACQLVLEAGAMGKGGEIYIFDMGEPVKIIDLARKMIKLAGFIPDRDIKIKIVGLRPGEKLYEELLNDFSKTIPTHHHKIMIAEEFQDEFEILHTEIDELISKAYSHYKKGIVAKMKSIVPEYKSMNSEYEILDN